MDGKNADWTLELAVFGGALAFAFALFWILRSGANMNRMQRRVARVKEHKKQAAEAAPEKRQSLRRRRQDDSLPSINRLLRTLPNLRKVSERLERAGMEISPERYMLLSFGLMVLIMFALAVLAKKSLLLSGLTAFAIGAGIPHIYVGIAAMRRMKRFIKLFPDAIDLIVRGLRSGLPVGESMKMATTEIGEPVGEIFEGVMERVRLGMTLEKALADVAEKLSCTEFNFFVTSIILQRETGGNLGEILDNLSEVLRKRTMMRLKIKALSSEAKASAIIVGALPFVVTLALFFMQPDYLDPLFNDFRGNIALAAAGASLLTGMGIMFKMSKFEI